MADEVANKNGLCLPGQYNVAGCDNGRIDRSTSLGRTHALDVEALVSYAIRSENISRHWKFDDPWLCIT